MVWTKRKRRLICRQPDRWLPRRPRVLRSSPCWAILSYGGQAPGGWAQPPLGRGVEGAGSRVSTHEHTALRSGVAGGIRPRAERLVRVRPVSAGRAASRSPGCEESGAAPAVGGGVDGRRAVRCSPAGGADAAIRHAVESRWADRPVWRVGVQRLLRAREVDGWAVDLRLNGRAFNTYM